jgi:hypothetical protein
VIPKPIAELVKQTNATMNKIPVLAERMNKRIHFSLKIVIKKKIKF